MLNNGESTMLIISIHAPHEGRDCPFLPFLYLLLISIHAPHEGRDYNHTANVPGGEEFQSTRPMRGATFVPNRLVWQH